MIFTNHLLSRILPYLPDLNKTDTIGLKTCNYDKNIYKYLFFSGVFLPKVSKIANDRTKKVLLITNLRTVNNAQLTHYLTDKSYQINTNKKR